VFIAMFKEMTAKRVVLDVVVVVYFRAVPGVAGPGVCVCMGVCVCSIESGSVVNNLLYNKLMVPDRSMYVRDERLYDIGCITKYLSSRRALESRKTTVYYIAIF